MVPVHSVRCCQWSCVPRSPADNVAGGGAQLQLVRRGPAAAQCPAVTAYTGRCQDGVIVDTSPSLQHPTLPPIPDTCARPRLQCVMGGRAAAAAAAAAAISPSIQHFPAAAQRRPDNNLGPHRRQARTVVSAAGRAATSRRAGTVLVKTSC